MQLQLLQNFEEWIQDIIDSRFVRKWSIDNLPVDQKAKSNFVRDIQTNTTENEFLTIVFYADTYCDCSILRSCIFCYIFDITESVTTQAYLDFELLEFDELEKLC